MRFKFLNVKSTFQELNDKAQAEVNVYHRRQANLLLSDLRDATPVDTGNARDSWRLSGSSKVINVINDTDYIDELNQGSSQQAPAFFVESNALKYGTPKGAIVEII